MVSKSEFSRRRKQLMRITGEGSVTIIPAAPVRIRNGDVDYPYRQDSDFYYLTGFAEPAAVLVLVPGREGGESVMFCRERDPARETWDGPMAGLEGVRELHGMDDAYPIADIDDILPNLIDGAERLYYTIGRDREFDQHVLSWVKLVKAQARHGARAPDEFISLEHHLHEMRLFKTRAEVSSMNRAAKIAAEAHLRAMRECAPGKMEYEIAATMMHAFLSNNAQPSYQPIVGGGVNACILHYVLNNAELRDGDLLLIDAGCEFDHYASDITRTFPVNGKFSPVQKDLYEVVLQGQLDAIEMVQPGNSWMCPHDAAVRTISQGLLDLGVLKGSVDQVLEEETYKQFYMHKTGHWLGMDVHDVGDYTVAGEPRELERGMTMTVEPGIYIGPNTPKVAKRWQGIGIRIEDDVVVTRDGHQVLSGKVPKTVAAIESLMAQ